MTNFEDSLVRIGEYLKANAYVFTTVTPDSHARVLERSYDPLALRAEREALRFLFGWNQQVRKDQLPTAFEDLLQDSSVFELIKFGTQDLVKSKIRFSTLAHDSKHLLFAHSGYPTVEEDSVFFGPDSYRFTNFVLDRVKHGDDKFPLRILDLGCGSGVGAITLASFLNKLPERMAEKLPEFYFTDMNERALSFSKANVRLNHDVIAMEQCRFQKSDLFKQVDAKADLVIANPPFIIDDKKRAYRHGGDHFGCALSAKMVAAAVDYLGQDGRLLMYTGASIVGGEDIFKSLIAKEILENQIHYQELDPDIFGEELSGEAYKDVDRIAAVGLDLTVQ